MNNKFVKKETTSLYLQLYDLIKKDIINEVYKFGQKLPSKRITADKTGLSIITVEHALALLEEEGYIFSKEKSGYYVSFKKTDGYLNNAINIELNKPYKQNTKLNALTNKNKFPFSVLAKTIRKVLYFSEENILQKSESCGLYEFREAIKNYLSRSRKISVLPEQIIIGAGSEYLYRLIIDLLGNKLSYAIESPSYSIIESVYKSYNIKTIKLKLDKNGIKSKDLLSSNADVLHISPYQSYPTGISASASKKHEYLNWALKNNKIIIEDDFESEFSILSKPEETLFSLSNKNVIYINSFSMTISPSFRTAYMILPQNLLQKYNKLLSFYSCPVPTFIQKILACLINDGSFERHIFRVRRNKRKLLKNLDK